MPRQRLPLSPTLLSLAVGLGGLMAAAVRGLLGEPGDIKTERAPGGIAAARTVAGAH